MSGAGNDFVLFFVSPDVIERRSPLEAFVRRVCDRHQGVGADGVLFVTPETRALGEARLVHYNADGGRSDFCGNGSRCAARFALLHGIGTEDPGTVMLHTDCGPLRAWVAGKNVRIEVPAPSEPAAMSLRTAKGIFDGFRVLAGVPHFVLQAENPGAFDLVGLGPVLRRHPDLGPEGANVTVVGAPKNGRHAIRTFERGVEGETLACGSGAIAAAAVLARSGAVSPIEFVPPSGIPLTAAFGAGQADGHEPGRFTLAGEAAIVFEGRLDVDGQDGPPIREP